MKLDDSIGFLINHTGRKISQLLNACFHPYDITTEQWTVLNRLGEQDGISQKDLSRRVGKDQTNVTRILDQLERKGFVKRIPNRVDRRSFLACLTEDGRLLTETLLPVENEVLRCACEGLSEEELVQFKQILYRIIENINQYSEMER